MIELASIFLVIILYLTPLNIVFYNISEWLLEKILGESLVGLSEMFRNSIVGVIYILLTIILLIIIFFGVKLFFTYISETKNKDDKKLRVEEVLYEYKKGQGYINKVSFLCILILLMVQIFLGEYDVRIFVLGILSMLFVFTSKRKPNNTIDEEDDKTEVLRDDDERVEELVYSWKYRTNPLNQENFINFTAKIKWSKERYLEYQRMDHSDSSAAFLSRYILDGKCPEIVELANQIKKMCRDRGFNTFHIASTVMAFQQSFRYKFDEDSKGDLEYVRYPLETLVDKEGDCDCHAICASTILNLMGYAIVLLRIIYNNGEGHLAFAIEGAEGLPGEFFEYEGGRYYYCESTPNNDNSSIDFTVGAMPDLSDASIEIIPVKEIVSL